MLLLKYSTRVLLLKCYLLKCYYRSVTPGVLLLECYSCDTCYALSVIHPECCNYIITAGLILVKCVAIDVSLLECYY